MKRQPTPADPGTSSITRRRFVKTAGVAAALAAGGAPFVAPKRAHASGHHEILHWNWLGASDKEVWSQMIDAFNDAHKDKGVQIKMEDVASTSTRRRSSPPSRPAGPPTSAGGSPARTRSSPRKG